MYRAIIALTGGLLFRAMGAVICCEPFIRVAIAAGGLLLWATGAVAQEREREMVPTPPPIEPANLFTIPTGRVVRSLDLEVSGSGILFGGEGVSSLGRAVLGLGDIAEMELGTLEMVSSLGQANRLRSVPAGGLKVYLPLWKYAHGLAASFRRSGTYEERTGGQVHQAKVGEFYAVASLANFPQSSGGVAPGEGWQGIKVKAHLGAKYVDARLDQGQGHFWRPVGGIEVWRDDARTRIVAELGWTPHFRPGGRIEDTQVVIAGVRFFFSKHVTFDIGVRHQDNFGGLSESTMQTRLHMFLPTHQLRERVVGR